MSTRSKLLAFTLLALPLPALAEAPAKSSLPGPVANMECLVGAWKGGGTLVMGKDRAKLEATWTCKRTPGEFGVACAFHITGIPGVAAYEETDLMGYEPGTNTYHWYSVTSAGETHDHIAKYADGPKLQFVHTGVADGKPFKEVIDLEFAKDGKSVTGRGETFAGGQSTSVLELKLRKP